MLKTQEFLLNGGTPQQLHDNLGIKITYHPAGYPIFILNYDQIESRPANHEIVVECRNLILESCSYNLISRSFPRFWNYGQYPEAYENFNWNKCFVQEKVDGSIMSLFWYNGEWMVSTRNSFAHLPCGESNKTWSELFFSILDKKVVKDICIPGTSYIFEFCSPWSKVIAEHKETKLFLLSAFQKEKELDKTNVDVLAKNLGVVRPQEYNFTSMDEVLSYIETQISINPTWEGVVICDSLKNRWKIKNPGYLALHRLANNGQGFSVKNLVPFILKGDEEEALIYIRRYFNEVIPFFNELKEKIDAELAKLLELWDEVKDITSQKEFAQAVIPRTKFSSLFFQARKQEKSVRELWSQSGDLILKVLYNQ